MLVSDHLERVLSSATFLKSDDPKLVLRYVVDRALEFLPVTGMDIAVDVFKKHDRQTEAKAKTANRNLKIKLLEYYSREGEGESIRIVFPERGFVPMFQWSDSMPTVPMGKAVSTNKDGRLGTAMRQRVNEWVFVVAGLSEMWARRTPTDAFSRQRFKEVFEPAFNKLNAVHTDYVTMFHGARSSISPRIHPDLVNALVETLAKQRITLEVVRMELQFLFAQLKEELAEPHVGRFVQISLEYVQPPSKGTRATTLMDILVNMAGHVDNQSDFDLARAARQVIDEEIKHLRTLMRQITKEYTSLRLATWRS